MVNILKFRKKYKQLVPQIIEQPIQCPVFPFLAAVVEQNRYDRRKLFVPLVDLLLVARKQIAPYLYWRKLIRPALMLYQQANRNTAPSIAPTAGIDHVRHRLFQLARNVTIRNTPERGKVQQSDDVRRQR